MHKNRLFNNKGFTLSELLIVMAIILVLVAVGMGVFGDSLERARETSDIATLRGVYASALSKMMTENVDTVSIKVGSDTKSYRFQQRDKDSWKINASNLDLPWEGTLPSIDNKSDGIVTFTLGTSEGESVVIMTYTDR